MKLTLAALLVSATTCLAQLTNLTFTWDTSPSATGYRFYELQGTNHLFIGTTGTNRFTVPGWNVTVSRTVTVTATNILGESADATPLVVPPAPTAPQHLAPIPLSIITPVPGVVEISQNLADWSQRIRLAVGPTSAVQVTWVQYPTEPVMFMRSKATVPMTTPPLP
jgi:hypothetical protein